MINFRLKFQKSKHYGETIFFRIKRSADELDNLLNEIAADDEYLNVPIHVIDKEKLQSSPLLQYLLLHKPRLFQHFE